jgi:hypothetical protein
MNVFLTAETAEHAEFFNLFSSAVWAHSAVNLRIWCSRLGEAGWDFITWWPHPRIAPALIMVWIKELTRPEASDSFDRARVSAVQAYWSFGEETLGKETEEWNLKPGLQLSFH